MYPPLSELPEMQGAMEGWEGRRVGGIDCLQLLASLAFVCIVM